MLAYRITHKLFSNELYASGIKGRWNGTGKKVIYCSESVPLAFLENMVRRQGVGFNDDFKIMVIEIPGNLKTITIRESVLQDGWRDFKDYSKCQPIGETWYEEAKTPILKVPPAVLPGASNFVLNTNHPDYKKISLIETIDLVPGQRIEEILKKYSGK